MITESPDSLKPSIQFWDAPVMNDGKRDNYNLPEMAAIVKVFETYTSVCAIEKVHAMPKNGSIGNFRLGYGLAVWEALVVSQRLRYKLVAPQTWKKVMMPDMPKEKEASRQRAHQLFPDLVGSLNLKKHHGRADALLIAEYLRRDYYRPINHIKEQK